MRKPILCVILSLSLVTAALAGNDKAPQPASLPATDIRVESSVPRGPVWDSLNHQEKKFAYHIMEAARAGRLVLFIENHRHGIVIKNFLESALGSAHIEDTKALLGPNAFAEFLKYATKFEDLANPYDPSNRKYILEIVTPAQLDNLLKIYSNKISPKVRQEVVALMTDPAYEVVQMPDDLENGSDLADAGGNFYEKGISGDEIKKALAEGLNPQLNSRIVRSVSGGLKAVPQTVSTPGLIGEALTKVVKELRLALPYSGTEQQKLEIEHLINYFEKGDVEEFRQASIAWVRDGHNSKVDFMLGFIEVYQDYRAQIGSWESYVQIVDPTVTELSVKLAKNAQYFEDAMPYGQFKKTFAKDYAPPAIMVYYFQEIASGRSSGYNLPNFDDIRRDIGAKNVIRLALPGSENDVAAAKVIREMMDEFSPAALVDRGLKYRDFCWRVLVLLHEIIGHGSGTYDTTKFLPKEDPVGAFGSLGSALEEERADLAALMFAGDPKLVEIGLFKDQAEATLIRNVLYDRYLIEFMQTLSKSHNMNEAHDRGNWLLINILMKKGVVGWAARDGKSEPTLGNQVLQVKDYQKFHDVSVELLQQLQQMKATRDVEGAKKLFAELAPLEMANEDWARAIIKRGENLAFNAGSIQQPWRVMGNLEFHTLCEGSLLENAAQGWRHQ